MFEKIYRCSRTIARHESGPLRDSRARYLEHLAEQGAAPKTVQAAAAVVYRAAVLMHLDDSRLVDPAEIQQAAKDWANRPFPYACGLRTEIAAKQFREVTRGWLRFAGRLRERNPILVPHQREMDAYCLYLQNERGLSVHTVTLVRYSLRKLFQYTGKCKLRQIDITVVQGFLAKLGEDGWTRHGIASMASRLRTFFRYGASQGWTKPGIGSLIRGPRVYRQESLPLGPPWPDVQRLLASTETNRPSDIRDRPVLLLFALYGMRASEVQRLCLDDINWEQHTLMLPPTKRHRPRVCPLIPSLQTALDRYIRQLRPPTTYREVFIRLKAPRKPVGHGALYRIVADRFRRLGVSSPRPGPHGLRHACATHLLAQGLTLTEIGNHLGHCSVESTRIYAKVDLTALRVVANLDLGGLL